MAEGTIGVVLGTDLDVATQLRWAVRLAEARSLDLLILQYVESREGKTVEVSLDEPPGEKTTPVARQVTDFIESSPRLRAGSRGDENGDDETHADADLVSVRLKEIRCTGLPSLRQQILVQIRKNKLKLCTAARTDFNTSDPDIIRERQLFLRYTPCEVVYCFGLQVETDLSRILVAGTTGPHAEAAFRLGRDLAAASDERLTAWSPSSWPPW